MERKTEIKPHPNPSPVREGHSNIEYTYAWSEWRWFGNSSAEKVTHERRKERTWKTYETDRKRRRKKTWDQYNIPNTTTFPSRTEGTMKRITTSLCWSRRKRDEMDGIEWVCCTSPQPLSLTGRGAFFYSSVFWWQSNKF